jgi:hypothetical protein
MQKPGLSAGLLHYRASQATSRHEKPPRIARQTSGAAGIPGNSYKKGKTD